MALLFALRSGGGSSLVRCSAASDCTPGALGAHSVASAAAPRCPLPELPPDAPRRPLTHVLVPQVPEGQRMKEGSRKHRRLAAIAEAREAAAKEA